MVSKFLIAFFLATAVGACLSETQTKQLVKDTAAYTMCLQICLAQSYNAKMWDDCADKCDKEFGVSHAGIDRRVSRALLEDN